MFLCCSHFGIYSKVIELRVIYRTLSYVFNKEVLCYFCKVLYVISFQILWLLRKRNKYTFVLILVYLVFRSCKRERSVLFTNPQDVKQKNYCFRELLRERVNFCFQTCLSLKPLYSIFLVLEDNDFYYRSISLHYFTIL